MRHVNALGPPYKGASSIFESKVVRIFEAEMIKDIKIQNRDPGKVIFLENGRPTVVCGRGLLKIYNMKSENGKEIIPLSKFKIKFT